MSTELRKELSTAHREMTDILTILYNRISAIDTRLHEIETKLNISNPVDNTTSNDVEVEVEGLDTPRIYTDNIEVYIYEPPITTDGNTHIFISTPDRVYPIQRLENPNDTLYKLYNEFKCDIELEDGSIVEIYLDDHSIHTLNHTHVNSRLDLIRKHNLLKSRLYKR